MNWSFNPSLKQKKVTCMAFPLASYLAYELMAMLSVIMESNQAFATRLSWTLHRMTLWLPSSSSDAAQCAIQGDAQMSLSWTALLAHYSELVHCCTAYMGTDWLLVLKSSLKNLLVLNKTLKGRWTGTLDPPSCCRKCHKKKCLPIYSVREGVTHMKQLFLSLKITYVTSPLKSF